MDYYDYLRFHQNALTFLGVGPKSNSRLYWLHTILFPGFFCVLFNISELFNMFLIYSDIKKLAANLTWCLVHSVLTLKIIVFLSKAEKIRSTCGRFRSGLLLIKDSKAKEEISLANKKCLRYLMVYYFFAAIVMVNSFIAPMYRDKGDSENQTRLPYYTYIPCDENTSPCFEVAYIYQSVSTSICTMVIIHCDHLYIVLVILSCSQFKILQKSLCTISQRAEAHVKIKWMNIGVVNLAYEIEREAFRLGNDCVRHHQEILAVSQEIEDTYNLLLLAQFLSHLIQLCFQMFCITEVSLLTFDGLSMIGFIITMLIEIYIFCQCAYEIETESSNISEAAYNADWTSVSEPLKKTLLLMMQRADRPVQFTAGKFLNLSRATFVSVLRGSFSYFAVLREIQ